MCSGRIRVPISIVPMPIRIRIWIGIKMESRIRISITTMPIHNTVKKAGLNKQRTRIKYWPLPLRGSSASWSWRGSTCPLSIPVTCNTFPCWRDRSEPFEKVNYVFNVKNDYDFCSVGDPDPHVYGPPEFGSIIQRYGSGSLLPFSHKGVERTEIMLAKENCNTKF